ncbi:MAG: DUF4870 domain-containing protein [Chloroflexi bacterium]|jgi:uncharacterized Tic20 family protein|nr:DUF4870 domain-containing protein [Chloroflexota bacterium]
MAYTPNEPDRDPEERDPQFEPAYESENQPEPEPISSPEPEEEPLITPSPEPEAEPAITPEPGSEPAGVEPGVVETTPAEAEPPRSEAPSAGAVPPREFPPHPTASTLSPSDERTWAMLAHLSVLANLFTGFLGPVAALVIYLVYKDRSRYVANQSMQSFIFQMVFWIGGGVAIGLLWTIVGALSAVLIGILCIPFAVLATIPLALAPIVALVYGVFAAIETSQGKPFKYWLVGDWVRDELI